MLWKLWARFLAGSLLIGVATAQQQQQSENPPPSTQIVRVRTGSSCGICSGDYYASETSVDRALMVSIHRSRGDKKNHPDMKTRYKITKQDWEDLQHFIDARVLADFAGRIGCPGCVDEPMQWAEVQFSDGTRKSVYYNEGNAPPAIAELLKKIQAIGAKSRPPQK
jgi:hypothetical protein